MANSVDQESFAALVARNMALVEAQAAAVRRLLVMTIIGPGPIVLSDATHGGKRLRVANGPAAATIELQLPADAPIGAVILPRQVGPALLRFTPALGATLGHRLGHNGTAGEGAAASLTCEANADGASAEWWLDGDTGLVA
jgi:hypothetical protein